MPIRATASSAAPAPATDRLRAKRDVEQSMASGRFTLVAPVIVLTVLNGNLPALLHLWFSRPEADSVQVAGTTAETLPHMLGLLADEARDLARRLLSAAT